MYRNMRHWGDWVIYEVAVATMKGLAALPRAWTLRITSALASLAYRLDGFHRRIMMENLRLAFPEWTETDRDRVCREAFHNLGRLLTEVCRLPNLNRHNISNLVRYDPAYGQENFRRAFAKGRGVVFLTGHFSSWELLPIAQALYGYPLTFVTRPLDNPYLEAWLSRRRRLGGNIPIAKKNSLRPLLQALRRGEAVGLLIDQGVQSHEGLFVEFFGRPACTTQAPALLALRTGAAVIPALLVRNQKEETYRMVFYEELDVISTGDRARDIRENTQRFAQAIETMVRRYPDQWLWGHRRWKAQPPHAPSETLKTETMDGQP